LRNFLTRTHLQDLIETTAQIHYEAFRAKQLLAIKESTQPQTPNAGHNGLGSNVLASGAGNPAMGSPAQSNK
jgi:septin 3/9/12